MVMAGAMVMVQYFAALVMEMEAVPEVIREVTAPDASAPYRSQNMGHVL